MKYNNTFTILVGRFVNLTMLSLFAIICFGCSNGKDKNEVKAEEKKNRVGVDKVLTAKLDSTWQTLRYQGRMAYMVYDLTADKIVNGKNENSLMHSASCMKLISGVAALKLLGTNFSYDTGLFMSGAIKNDTLYGDITLKTMFDPQFQATDLQELVTKLKSTGLKYIKGNVILDAKINEAVKSEQHWFPWDLSFSKYGILYKGSDRVLNELKRSLQAKGIGFNKEKAIVATIPNGSKPVGNINRSIDAVIERMWMNSSNTQSTGLLYTIGNMYQPKSSNYPAAGVEYLYKFIKEELQVETNDTIHDGCGLCIHNRLSPKTLCKVLRYGYMHKDIYSKMQKFLPISGKNGTLAHEMTKGAANGKIQAKTGTLSHPYGISSLAGFATSKNGHQLCFSVMCYDMSVLDARVIQRKMCEAMVKY